MTTDPRCLPDGRPVPPLSWGCWRLTTDDIGEARQRVETALDAGMTMVDTADVYGLDWGGHGFGANEEILGRVLAEAPGLRDRMILATKGGIVPGVPYDSSPGSLRAAVTASLGRLQVDHIDLWYVHRPDMLTHPAEVAETLTALVHDGVLGAIGVSNHTPAQVEALAAHLPPDVPLAANQFEFSPAVTAPLRDGTLDQCMRDDRMAVAWSPLGGGALVEAGSSPLAEALDAIAADRGVSRAAVAIGFVLSHPARPVAVVGTQSPERMKELAAAGDLALTRAESYRIIEASEGVPLP